MNFKLCVKIDGKDVCIKKYSTKREAEVMARKWKEKGYYVIKEIKYKK